MSDKTAPSHIYLQLGNEPTTYEEAYKNGWEVTWCADAIEDHDIAYIRADLSELAGPDLDYAEEISRLRAEVERLTAALKRSEQRYEQLLERHRDNLDKHGRRENE